MSTNKNLYTYQNLSTNKNLFTTNKKECMCSGAVWRMYTHHYCEQIIMSTNKNLSTSQNLSTNKNLFTTNKKRACVFGGSVKDVYTS